MIKANTEELLSILTILEEQIETINEEIDSRQLVTSEDMGDFGFNKRITEGTFTVYEKDLEDGLFCDIVLDILNPQSVFINLKARKQNMTATFSIDSLEDFIDLLNTLQID